MDSCVDCPTDVYFTYWDAVLYFTILWTVILGIVAIYNIWRSGRESELIKRNLKKETFETKVLKKKKDFLSNQNIVNLGTFW